MGLAGRYAAALLAAALLAGCSSGDRGEVRSDQLPPALLTVHRVLREEPPPCSSPSPDGHVVVGPTEGGGQCLVLERAEVDARDLRTVVLQEATSEDDLNIAVTLNAKGTERFTNLAGRSLGRPLAILTNGELLAAPRVESPSTTGELVISDVPRDHAIDLVRRLGGDPTPPRVTPESDALRRATKLCEGYVATLGPEAEASLIAPRTAGEVTSVSQRFLGRTTPPWDSLPADHFVASCSYTFPVTSSTVRCRSGAILPPGGAVLLDEEGRITPDPAATITPESC